jgi:hypothetical protein
MAGFEVTLYGRFWVTPEAAGSRYIEGTFDLLVPNYEYQFHKRFVWRRLGTRTRLFSPLNCPYVIRKMKNPD